MSNFAHAWSDVMGGAHIDTIEEEERGAIFGFWRRLQRGIGSEEVGDTDEADSEGDSDWSTEDEDVEDDEDDEDLNLKDFSLLGRKQP